MKICAIADTHDNHRQIKIPECDVLIVAGDFTCHRSPVLANYVDFNDWLGEIPLSITRKLVVAGNHDTLFEKNPSLARSVLTNCTYLEDSGTSIEGINFWGSPWTPFFNSWVFMKPDEMLEQYWHRMPDETNVLITHGPSFGVLDKNDIGQNCGSYSLLERVSQLAQLKLHVFGHIHESFGTEGKFINASQTDLWNRLVNQPVVIDI